MGFSTMLKETIKRSDLLGAPTMLRRNGQPFYESLFGGIITIVLFGLFTIIFAFKLQDLITLQNINSSDAISNNQNDTSPITNFFFGITIPYITYDQMSTYFNIQLLIVETGQPDVPVNLVNCTAKMWNSRGIYNDLLNNGYLCPEQNNKLNIYKTVTKEAYLKLVIDCTDCSDPGFQTLSNTIQQNYDLFSADIQMINSIISTSNQDPITVYIQTIPVSTFGADLGLRAQIQLTPYQIDTDVSFLPYKNQKALKGYYISDRFSTKTLLYSGPYASFKISKSKLQYTVSRQYGKFDDLLSYVGGLFSLLFVVFAFFLGPYNQLKYQFMIAEATFKNDSLDNVNKITESNWNFLTYLKYIIYDWFLFFDCPPKKWKEMKEFNQSRSEALYLLDAKYLVKRIRFLQSAVDLLLPKHKQTCLRIIDNPQIEKIRRQRKKMELFDQYIQHKNHQKKKAKQLADILLKKTLANTIFEFAKPSQKYLQANSQDLKKWKEEVSDSEYIEDEQVKHQIQIAIKQMLQKKQSDDDYNKIYDLMDDDFKGWANLSSGNSFQQIDQGQFNSDSSNIQLQILLKTQPFEVSKQKLQQQQKSDKILKYEESEGKEDNERQAVNNTGAIQNLFKILKK